LNSNMTPCVKDSLLGDLIPGQLDPVGDDLAGGLAIVADSVLRLFVGHVTFERTVNTDVQRLQL
jgi:hypothetical protein